MMRTRFDHYLKEERVVLWVIAAVALFAGLGGCGFKTMPVPPQQVMPQPITDLRYELSEKGVTLFWSQPTKTVTGSDLSGITAFELYRAVVPVESYCENCPVPFGSPITMPAGELPEDGKKTITYESTLLRPGNLFFFKVRSRVGWWARSTDSNIVSFIWYIPPKAPKELKAEAGDSRVMLSWQAPSDHLDGTAIIEPIRYRVFRSLAGSPFTPVGELRDSLSFTDDSGLKNGMNYFYKVQTVSVYEKGTVGGGSSESIGISPVDLTPPAPPVGLRAVRTANSMKVFWDPNKEKDLQGYKVYRRLPEGNAVLVGTVEAPYTMFVDKAIPKDAEIIYYAVSSYDRSSAANESVKSSEVMVRND